MGHPTEHPLLSIIIYMAKTPKLPIKKSYLCQHAAGRHAVIICADACITDGTCRAEQKLGGNFQKIES